MDMSVRKVLIEENLGLVRHVTRRFAGRGAEPEDLFQIGTIGLIKAVDRYDESLGTAFSTYAVPMILGEIRCFLRQDGPIKISRTIRENARRLALLREEEQARLHREPRLAELAKAADLSLEETMLALEADGALLSLEHGTETAEGEALPLMERIAADTFGGIGAVTRPGSVDAEKEAVLDRMLLGKGLDGLEKAEKKLIFLRYFRGATQSSVAKELGISQVQVSRREKKILEKLRQVINS